MDSDTLSKQILKEINPELPGPRDKKAARTEQRSWIIGRLQS